MGLYFGLKHLLSTYNGIFCYVFSHYSSQSNRFILALELNTFYTQQYINSGNA
jgi:hypothetical protein